MKIKGVREVQNCPPASLGLRFQVPVPLLVSSLSAEGVMSEFSYIVAVFGTEVYSLAPCLRSNSTTSLLSFSKAILRGFSPLT